MTRKRKPRPQLPPACSFCRPNDGLWRSNEVGGLSRCDCPRGVALAAMAEEPWEAAGSETEARTI